MTRLQSLIAGAGVLTCGSILADLATATGSTRQSLGCALTARAGLDGIDLTASASSAIAVDGSYRLVVAKHGEAGLADVEQSGSFAVAAGGTSTLSSVSLSLERGAGYVAKLTVTVRGAKATCSRILPLGL